MLSTAIATIILSCTFMVKTLVAGVRKNTHGRKTTYLADVLHPDGSVFDLEG